MNYNLGVLNDKEFEDLAKDLLELELGLKLENFKVGKDNGIDLRYSSTKKNEIIVQVKHFFRSKFSDLKFQLGKEKEKLDKLSNKPERYIVFTSLPLNTNQTEELEEVLSPYLINTGDIYNHDRIQSLISQSPQIEKKFYKLWLSSSNVLNEILHNAQTNCSEFIQEKIIKRSKLYVETKHLHESHDFLVNNKILIITGEPGVGKTTLAYMLVYKFLGEGFELIFSDRSVLDAENLLSKDKTKKQIILIDDFLGSNLTDINSTPNNDSIILRFLEQVKCRENKFLVLTTRTTILNEATYYYESFKRERLKKTSGYELKVKQYTKLEKAQILYNHLYHSELSGNLKDFFFVDKNYLKIIDHPNYYPRIIEILTSEALFEDSGYHTFDDYIFRNLENPKRIWEHAFKHQTNRSDQLLIETVFTFGDKGVEETILEDAFNQRLDLEIRTSNHEFNIDPFNDSLKKLLESFLKIEISRKDSKKTISFVNPSITDFLLDYLKTNNRERKQVWDAAKYIEQFEPRFGARDTNYLCHRENEEDEYLASFVSRLNLLRTKKPKTEISLRILHFMSMMFSNKLDRIKDEILQYFELVFTERIDNRRLYEVIKIIKNSSCISLQEYINLKFDVIIEFMVEESYRPEDIRTVIDLNEDFGIDFNRFLENEMQRNRLREIIFENFMDIFKDQELNICIEYDRDGYFDSRSTAYEIEREAKVRFKSFLEEEDLLDYFNEDDFYEGFDYDPIINDLYKNINYSPEKFETEYSPRRSNSGSSVININDEIDRLFER
ncbi:restriction endonuclease [Sphingobacterium sp.]|uniref:nSTAND3 domain-containing NTPase n=1 Tax=Sphingobacterium sp. TaxID=341027 RepID=UPI0031E2A310